MKHCDVCDEDCTATYLCDLEIAPGIFHKASVCGRCMELLPLCVSYHSCIFCVLDNEQHDNSIEVYLGLPACTYHKNIMHDALLDVFEGVPK